MQAQMLIAPAGNATLPPQQAPGKSSTIPQQYGPPQTPQAAGGRTGSDHPLSPSELPAAALPTAPVWQLMRTLPMTRHWVRSCFALTEAKLCNG